MSDRITINPVTRIEGHGKVTIHLDDEGKVSDAHFHVTQFRGFERIAQGRPFHELPGIMARTCGICPVSHLIAGGKAGDEILAVEIPETAKKLRRILNLAQLLQSHALSFFHLSSPDLLLGMDADPAARNIIGLATSHPQLAKDGIFLRKFGQEIIARLAGRRIHPAWVVAGGVSSPLAEADRDAILAEVPEAYAALDRTLKAFKPLVANFKDEIASFANYDSLHFGMVGPDGELEHYDGKIRIVNAEGEIVADGLDPSRYDDYIEERIEPWSFLKSPFYKPLGYPEGMYRVGPLARLNLISKVGTPKAEVEWQEFRALDTGTVKSTFHNHYARLIEILHAIEIVESLLKAPDILSTRVRAQAGPNRLEGVGVAEAPRGTLIHHYKIDENGLTTWINMIIATGHNNLAINKGVLQVAQRFVDSKNLKEPMLNRVEAVVRAFDPCLSCSTHAVGQMPLKIQLFGGDGSLLDELSRG